MTLTVEEAKRKLVQTIKDANEVKSDGANSQQLRLRAEDQSFEAYEKLLALCDGDTDTVQRLLHGRSKASWDREYREQFKEKVRKETENRE